MTFTVISPTDHQQMTRDHCQQFVFSSDADPATDESGSLALPFAGVGGLVELVGVWYFSCDGDLTVVALVMNDGEVNGKVTFFTPVMCGIIRRQPAQRGA